MPCRGCAGVHVVTRNSHKEDIEVFLAANGLPDVKVNVCPKKVTKGSFIKASFFEVSELGGSPELGSCAALFVDDDIRELIADPWLRENGLIHRLLFCRAI